MAESAEKFESWCIVELFGHTQLAGYVTEATIGGQSFVRIDVPACHGQNAFTRFLGQGAIYSMTPTDQETCYLALKSLRPRPVSAYCLPMPSSTPEQESFLDDDLDPDDDIPL